MSASQFGQHHQTIESTHPIAENVTRMSDSESSKDFGFVAENHDTDESEDTTESVSDGSSEADCLFDLEASDAEDEEPGQSEDGDIDWSFGVFPEGHTTFPQFMKLPIELRFRIWEFFCPELTGNGRVLCFKYDKNNRSTWIEDSLFLDQVTVRARAVLSVHRESRQLAIKAFPDTLTFGDDGRSAVRFNASKDIISLESLYRTSPHSARGVMRSIFHGTGFPSCPGFTEHVRLVCVELNDLGPDAEETFKHFPNLQTIYVDVFPTFDKPELLRWCTSDRIKRYSFNHFWEDEVGNGCFAPKLYCCPDLVNHKDFAETQIPLEAFLNASQDVMAEDLHDVKFGGSVWPLVQFDGWEVEFLERVKIWDGKEDLGKYVVMELDPFDDPGEYESEGIDDSEIPDDDSDDSEDDPYLDSEDESEDGMAVDDDDQSDDGIEPSSPGDPDAPSSAEDAAGWGSDATASGSDSEGAPRLRAKRARARLVVPDSDNDEDDDVQPRKRTRIEDSDEDASSGPDRANHASGDDDSEEEWSGISGSNNESEESEIERKGRPVSLVEKLQLHRRNNPIPSTDDEDSGSEDEDDCDSRYHARYNDDDEGSEVSDEEGYNDQYGCMEDDDEDEEDEY
ncbi:hypothetical protein VTJ49DRAFT_2719 [Mycothermus thermophilus]|uniref:2EXR domain-containing protein n=1 Tax=Humicola insolens TaxID=85995 RepID=A0ABR3V9D0_HUMIN